MHKFAKILTTSGIIYAVSCSERKLLDSFVSSSNNSSIIGGIDATLTLTAGCLTTAVMSSIVDLIINNTESDNDPIYQNYNKNIKALGLSLGAHALFRYMTQESP